MPLPIHGIVLWGAMRAGPVRPRHLWPSLLPIAPGIGAATAGLSLLHYDRATTPMKIVNLSLDICWHIPSFGVFLLVPSQLRASLVRKLHLLASAQRVARFLIGNAV